MKQLKDTTQKALSFLSNRMPSSLNLSRIDWVCLLTDFQTKKGDDALEALAGAYIYAIDNFEGDKQSSVIDDFIGHDLGERNDEFSLPRSSSYREFWLKECNKY